MTRYDIYFENKPIGIACVESVGLYTQFQCRCSFRNEGSYRIIAQYGAVQIDLGLCIPANNMFVTNAKIATKKLNGSPPYFFALDIKQNNVTFVPVDPQENFSFIEKLSGAKFHIKNGIKGILIQK